MSFKPPVRFEENRGQANEEVKYVVRGAGAAVSLTAREAVSVLGGRGDRAGVASSTVRFRLVGANAALALTAKEPLEARANYFIGNDPARWKTNVPSFGRVRYDDVYPGIDLEYHGSRGSLEYDFIVAPGADPGRIRLSFKGASRVFVNRKGDLVLKTPGGDLVHRRPLIYQNTDEGRRRIAGRYLVGRDRTVTFRLGRYIQSLPLVIDPEIVYSSYLGGQGYERAWDVAAPGDSGQVYVAGVTTSTDFPGEEDGKRRDLYRGANVGGTSPLGEKVSDAFIAKFDTSKSGADSLVYSAYFGGSYLDTATGIEVDGEGNLYVIGDTTVGEGAQSDFPMLSKLQGLDNQDGCGARPDDEPETYGFVARFNPDATQMHYSKCLDGFFTDGLNAATAGGGLSLDRQGHVYVAGGTSNENFGVRNAAQSGYGGGSSDAFIVKLLADGSRVTYATLLGGGGRDTALHLDSDHAGNAYVTGLTRSDAFPRRNAFQETLAGIQDAFVSKLDTVTGGPNSLLFSTYLGGDNDERGWAVAVDEDQNAYVAGDTQSGNFPTRNAMQPRISPADQFQNDAFVAKLDTRSPAAGSVVFSTYLGGSGVDVGMGLALDSERSVYVTGGTGSSDFPLRRPFQPVAGTSEVSQSAYLTKLSPRGDKLVYSSFLGSQSKANAIAVDSSANVYLVGETASPLFPQEKAYQVQNAGGSNDAFITRVSPLLPKVSAVVPATGPTAGGTAVLIQGAGFPDPAELAGSVLAGEPPVTVHFGEKPALEVTPVSAAHLRAISPPHEAGTVDVTVKTFEGTSPKVAEDRFTYLDPDVPEGPPSEDDLPDGFPSAESPPPLPSAPGGLGSSTGAPMSAGAPAHPGVANQPPGATPGLPQGPPPTGPLTAPATISNPGQAQALQTSPSGVVMQSAVAHSLPGVAAQEEQAPSPAPGYLMTGRSDASWMPAYSAGSPYPPAGLALFSLAALLIWGRRADDVCSSGVGHIAAGEPCQAGSAVRTAF